MHTAHDLAALHQDQNKLSASGDAQVIADDL